MTKLTTLTETSVRSCDSLLVRTAELEEFLGPTTSHSKDNEIEFFVNLGPRDLQIEAPLRDMEDACAVWLRKDK